VAGARGRQPGGRPRAPGQLSRRPRGRRTVPGQCPGDNSKKRERVTVARGGRESGGVPEPARPAGAGPSLCERGRAECVIKDGKLFSFSVQFKQTRDLSGIRK